MEEDGVSDGDPRLTVGDSDGDVDPDRSRVREFVTDGVPPLLDSEGEGVGLAVRDGCVSVAVIKKVKEREGVLVGIKRIVIVRDVERDSVGVLDRVLDKVRDGLPLTVGVSTLPEGEIVLDEVGVIDGDRV